MDSTYTPRRVRSRPVYHLLVTLALGIAVLATCAGLFGAALYTNIVPSFDQQIPLSRTHHLEVSVGPDYYDRCAMSGMACLDVKDMFPRTFRVEYWVAGEQFTLVSIVLPPRLHLD